MKKLTFWLSVAGLTFIVGVACVFLWWIDRPREKKANAPFAQAPAASEPEQPEVPFCQLIAKAEDYEGKVVRVRAIYSFNKHGSYIGDRSCISRETSTYVSASPSMWDEIERTMENAYGEKNVVGPLDITAVGIFERNHPTFESDVSSDTAAFRFNLVRIERAARAY